MQAQPLAPSPRLSTEMGTPFPAFLPTCAQPPSRALPAGTSFPPWTCHRIPSPQREVPN